VSALAPLEDELSMTVREMLHDWQSGHGVVMDEGISYNATCDGKNHYLYKINKKALNPKTGLPYSKGRIYAGKFDREKSPAYCDQWLSKHACGHGRVGAGHGRATENDAQRGENDAAEVIVQWVMPRTSVNS